MYPKMPHILAVRVVYVKGEDGAERGRWARGSMAARAERSEERAGEVEGYDGMGVGVGLDRPALNECKRLAGSNEMVVWL